MAIDPTRSANIGARAAELAAELGDRAPAGQTDRATERRDQVEISDQARELARQEGAEGVPAAQARLAEIRDRLENGFYDRPEVLKEIAERILESGDL